MFVTFVVMALVVINQNQSRHIVLGREDDGCRVE